MMHLYKEVSRFYLWEGHLEVLDDLDATGLIDTDGSDFRGIGHGITELVEGMLCHPHASHSNNQTLDGFE